IASSSALPARAWVMATSGKPAANATSRGASNWHCKSSSRLTPGRYFLWMVRQARTVHGSVRRMALRLHLLGEFLAASDAVALLHNQQLIRAYVFERFHQTQWPLDFH